MAQPTTASRGGDGTRHGSGRPRQGAGPGRRPPAPDRRRFARRRATLASLAIAVLAAAFVSWALYGSSWLRTERVRVGGTRVLTATQVARAADVPLGGPLASVDTAAVARRVRAALPRVRTVRVVRSWPHTLSVRVAERTPLLSLRRGGKYGELDADGVLFATVAAPARGVPLLHLAGRVPSGAGRAYRSRPYREAAEVVSALPSRLRTQVLQVRVGSFDDVTLELTGDRSVVWGSSEEGAAKARVLAALMKAAPHARRYDVEAPSAPAAAGS
ncbi:cell division protein FtsQ/DivIB [Streptomyces sp. NPDC059740]|uniref:cell division protein FtsQ/DivIB n=1 Tax=Streptomyces sp. NPDC059740 TaxID=3346926 RepID=UPI003660AFF3